MTIDAEPGAPGQNNPASLFERAIDLPKPVVATACRLLENLFGEPMKAAGALLADQVYTWQWGNRLRIAQKAQKIMERDGIAARILPPDFLLPLLEAAGNVGDMSLQELWAQLLASAVESDEHRHPNLIEVLRRMDSNDAKYLEHLCQEREPGIHGESVPHDGSPQDRAASHLESLGLARVLPLVHSLGMEKRTLGPTAFGLELHEAVHPRADA